MMARVRCVSSLSSWDRRKENVLFLFLQHTIGTHDLGGGGIGGLAKMGGQLLRGLCYERLRPHLPQRHQQLNP